SHTTRRSSDLVYVEARNLAAIVVAEGHRAAGAEGDIECAEAPRSQQEPMALAGDVGVFSHDLPGTVEAPRHGGGSAREIDRGKCKEPCPLGGDDPQRAAQEGYAGEHHPSSHQSSFAPR